MTGPVVTALAPSPPRPPTVGQFVATVVAALERDGDRLEPASALVGVVCRDELDLLVVFGCCDRWLGGFHLPDQLAPDHATLGDVHHYLVTYLAQRTPDAATAPEERSIHGGRRT